MTEALDQIAEEVSEEGDRARLEVVACLLDSTFGFLREFGYELESVDIDSSELHRLRTVFTWRSNFAVRELSVRYLPYDPEGRRSDTLHASIVKTLKSTGDGEDNFEASEDYMSLRMYLESKCPSFDSDALEVSNYGGDFAERVEKVLQAYAYYMQDVAEDVIRGDHWEAGHFHQWH